MRRVLPIIVLLAGSCTINPDLVPPPPPLGLNYSTNPASYLLGQQIPDNVPSRSGGGPADSYEIHPTLPAGLDFNTTSGIISGTPTAISRAASYTVTAMNRGGSTTATLTIAVVDETSPPAGLAYLMNPATYTRGQAIAPNVPSSSGGPVESYDANPSLPEGLSIHPMTGVISGTPIVVTPGAVYVVTATNPGGSTQAMLTITVNDQPPTGLSYSSNPATYTRGQAISNNVPTSSGGAVVTYSVAPPLSAGLTINPSTGVISGTPTVVSSAASYTVTATNSGGSTQATLTITVNDQPPAGAGIDFITAGYGHTCAVVDGGARCWGDNGFGQLGDIAPGGISGHVQVFGLTSGVQAIAAGDSYTCATADGGVRCWGDNDNGQLGDNSYNGATRPVQVTGLLSGASVVTAGSDHSCAIVNGGARCWGDNTYGQLGNNSLDAGSPIPVQVTGLTSGVQAIAAGSSHTCAVVDGGARCWGKNMYGQLGNNSYVATLVPVEVTGLTSGVHAIATGCNHTCAIVSSSRSARCWGDNSEGQLGDGTFSGKPTPIQPAGMASGVQAITTGCLHTCAIVNGSARCWGNGTWGQLGNNATATRATNVQVIGLTSGTQLISSGYYHVCATQDGGLQCWGWNNVAQLGNGNTTNSLVPVPIAP